MDHASHSYTAQTTLKTKKKQLSHHWREGLTIYWRSASISFPTSFTTVESFCLLPPQFICRRNSSAHPRGQTWGLTKLVITAPDTRPVPTCNWHLHDAFMVSGHEKKAWSVRSSAWVLPTVMFTGKCVSREAMSCQKAPDCPSGKAAPMDDYGWLLVSLSLVFWLVRDRGFPKSQLVAEIRDRACSVSRDVCSVRIEALSSAGRLRATMKINTCLMCQQQDGSLGDTWMVTMTPMTVKTDLCEQRHREDSYPLTLGRKGLIFALCRVVFSLKVCILLYWKVKASFLP